MKNMSHHVGTLEVIKRLPSSINGNPRYLIRVGGVECRTSVDSSHGYGITNHEGQVIKAIIGAHYGKATLDDYMVA